MLQILLSPEEVAALWKLFEGLPEVPKELQELAHELQMRQVIAQN